MKKIIALILVSTLLVSMAACSSTANNESTPDTDKSNETSSTERVEGTLSSAVMFDVTLTPEWTEEVDSRYEGDAFSTVIYNVVEDEEVIVSVEITLDTADVTGFRDSVKLLGVDLYEYAVNDAGERFTIADYECVMAVREYWGEELLSYVGRDEKSGTTLEVDVYGDFNNPLVTELLSTLTPKTEDLGLVDYPYFWDGKPFATTDLTAQVGNFTITSTPVPLEEPTQVNDIFSIRVAKIDDSKIYLGYDNMLLQYNLSDTLTAGEFIALEDTFSEMESDNNGNLFISSLGSNLVKLTPDKSSLTYNNISEMISIHPSGEWGLTYFVNSEVERVDLNGDSAAVSTFKNKDELFDTDTVRFTTNHILLFGNEIDSDTHKVMVLDNNKTPLFILGGDDFAEDDDYYGAITDVVETSNGFIVADGNLRDFYFYDLQGNYIGNLSDSDLLGTSYPWISDMQLMDDGSILIAYSQQREDYSGYEVLITKITGF